MLKRIFCLILFRGRKKRMTLLIILTLVLYAMLYVSLELYQIVKRNKDKSWFRSITYNKIPNEDGIKVIVGHYVGGSTGANLSEEDIHSNRYAPVPGAGGWGRPVQLSPREMVRARDLYSLHNYNIYVGDKISITRSLPDVRSEACRQVNYDVDNLPVASVIIVFHNEAWSTLMRTIMSVLLRTPDRLLKEIILVDDASDRRYLGKELDDALKDLEKVVIVRCENRTGLVGARLVGVRAATADILVFLDAHCEVTPGWMEPLLDRAASDDVYICPQIDLLNDDTLSYTKSIDAHLGAFNWNLQFRWIMPSKKMMEHKAKDPSKPYPTPAMAGGLFAVKKSLFWRLGGYDEGMYIWGAENLELSWRAWQCGARVEITSCSRVGHIFRIRVPYKYPGDRNKIVNLNIARAAAVWMDEWADFYFKFDPHASAIRDSLNVTDRVQLRQKLKCKTFKWYLENIWPDHYFPSDERWFGRIKNDKGACIGANYKNPVLAGPAVGEYCRNDLEIYGLIVYTPEGRIVTNEGKCLEQGKGRTIWKDCNGDNKKQVWLQKGPRLKSLSGMCLTLLVKNNKQGIGDPISETPCREDATQIWHFERVPWR